MITHTQRVLVLAVAAAALLAAGSGGSARAGIIDGTLSTTLPGSSWANVGADGNGFITLSAAAEVASGYEITGTLDGFDPNLAVLQNITNTTGTAWDSYTVTINPALGYTLSNIFVNAPISQPNYLPNVFGFGALPVAVTSGNQIIYSGGLVPAGATFQMYFSFDISETSGTFGYGVVNTPHLVPEPASMAVLGLGAMMLLRRKRA